MLSFETKPLMLSVQKIGINVNETKQMRITADLCNEQGISFIPVVAESTGGWHKIAIEQLKKLGSALARHTGQQEGETIAHLITRVSVQLQKGLSAMILNRIPSHAAPVVGGVQ